MSFQMATVTPENKFHVFNKEELEVVIKDI